MRKFTLTLFAAVSFFQFVNAVEPIMKFYCSALTPFHEFTIESTPIYKNGTFNLDIPILSYDGEADKVYLRIPSKKIPKFVAELHQAKEIYIRWANAAKKNNVSTLEAKRMDIKPTTYEARFFFGDWHFVYSATPIYAFRIDKNEYGFLIGLNEIQSSDNQFVKSDGGILWFTSVEEIEAFIKCIDPQLVEDHYAAKKSVESIFN